MHSRAVLVVGLAVLRVGFAQAALSQTPAPELRFAGCYTISLPASLPIMRPDTSIRLLADTGFYAFEERQWLIRRLADSTALPYRFAYWRAAGQDTIDLTWTTGFTYTSILISQHGGELSGPVYQANDMRAPKDDQPRGRAILHPRPCP